MAAPLYSQAGYSSLAVLDATDPFAPTALCTVNNSPYPIQPIQWVSPAEFLLVVPGQPYRLLDVDVQRRSISTLRGPDGAVYQASFSPDRAWLATMESGAGDTRVARLYGPTGARTLATYPPLGGHGGTIYGFGGPTIGFSPDGSMVLAVDYGANYIDPKVPDLQVFDLQGSPMVSALKGLWAVWDAASLYYDGEDGNLYRWERGAAPVAISQSGWLEPRVSPDGQLIAYLEPVAGSTPRLKVKDTRSGIVITPRTSGQRIDPLFVNGSVIWISELVPCANCYGGNNPTGKVFAYDSSTGSESEVGLPNLLAPLAGASLSSGR